MPWHNWKISSWKIVNGEPYHIGKTWQGKGYGYRGFTYFSGQTIQRLIAISNTGAFTVFSFKRKPMHRLTLTTSRCMMLPESSVQCGKT